MTAEEGTQDKGREQPCPLCSINDGVIQEWLMRVHEVARSKGFDVHRETCQQCDGDGELGYESSGPGGWVSHGDCPSCGGVGKVPKAREAQAGGSDSGLSDGETIESLKQQRDVLTAQVETLKAALVTFAEEKNASIATLTEQVTTLREALKEMAANWHRKAVKSDEEHGEGYAEEMHECADELSALLSSSPEGEPS